MATRMTLAMVTTASPLTITLDGDTAALPASTAVPRLAAGDRVLVFVQNGGSSSTLAIVTARVGGPAPLNEYLELRQTTALAAASGSWTTTSTTGATTYASAGTTLSAVSTGIQCSVAASVAVYGVVEIAGNSTGLRGVTVTIGGTSPAATHPQTYHGPGTSSAIRLSVAGEIDVTAGQVLTLRAWQGSGSSLNINAWGLRARRIS